MKIETFAQRQKAQRIYDTYFDANTEHCLDFSFVNTLNFYGAIEDEDFDDMVEKFDQIGNNLWAEMKKFDENNFKNS